MRFREWHYELNETPSGYYVMTIRDGPPPWECPVNKGYWIQVKTVNGGWGKKWISLTEKKKKPIAGKIKETIKNKISKIKNIIRVF